MTDVFMRRAIALAKKAQGLTSPNPIVGAVLTKGDNIIGEGYHHKAGLLHAEREALKDCARRGYNPAGSTLWVTLEPCCHKGRQPACTAAIIESGVKTVVIGSGDPNPLVNGQGVNILRAAGVTVITGILKDECDALNKIFFHYITKHTPYVALKMATTIDNKIATKTHQSKWITGEDSRAYVKQLRRRYFSIMCGVGTVIADDPMLRCAPDTSDAQPIRVICDSTLRTPLTAKVVTTADISKTIIFHCDNIDSAKARALSNKGVTLIEAPRDKNGHADITYILKKLAALEIDSVFIEGGAALFSSALDLGVVQHIYHFIAPMFFGKGALDAVQGAGVDKIADATRFAFSGMTKFTSDILVEWERTS